MQFGVGAAERPRGVECVVTAERGFVVADVGDVFEHDAVVGDLDEPRYRRGVAREMAVRRALDVVARVGAAVALVDDAVAACDDAAAARSR